MGAHRFSPRAINAANRPPRSFQAAEPRQADVTFGFQLELAIEPNAEAKLRMEAEAKRCVETGEPPPKWKLQDFTDHEKDMVVYKTYGIARTKTPGGLELRQPVETAIRVGEVDRRPLASLLEREAEGLQRFLAPSVAEG